MKLQLCIFATLLALFFAPQVHAELITPANVLATSEWGIDIFATNLIDGSGLIDLEETPDNEADDYHDNAVNWLNGWHSGDVDAGIPGGLDDDGDLFTPPSVDDQILEFDLGAMYSVTTAHIWQQNQSGLGTFLAPLRGVDEFEILSSASLTGDEFSLVGRYALEPEEGIEEVPAQVVTFEAVVARRIRFDITSALSGEPTEFVGLGEVRFEGTPINDALPGDFDGNSVLDEVDIDLLSAAVESASNNRSFDLNNDALVDKEDRRIWVEDLRATYFGDSNLDGEFNSTDFVAVFQAGEYEDEIAGNSKWASGDWNGDREFDSSDFVAAFQAGGYEVGPRQATASVPEPSSCMMLILGIVFLSSIGVRVRTSRRA